MYTEMSFVQEEVYVHVIDNQIRHVCWLNWELRNLKQIFLFQL